MDRVTNRATQTGARRNQLSFAAVNRKGQIGYLPDFQKHHLVPSELESNRGFAEMLNVVRLAGFDLDDFRINGTLLPGVESASLRTGLPLHRGPHRSYTELVSERFAEIERSWRGRRFLRNGAKYYAAARIRNLAGALRRKLLTPKAGEHLLSRNCPLGQGRDFAVLDAMAEELWAATSAADEI